MKTVVVDTPVETCDMEPQEVCKQITKLVPQLKPIQECVQVMMMMMIMTMIMMMPGAQRGLCHLQDQSDHQKYSLHSKVVLQT